jgi:putative redox protein
MAQGTVHAKWVEGELFVGADRNGRTILIGNTNGREPTWGGSKPSDLLMLGLISCSGFDVVDILAKQHQQLTGFEISATGDQNDEPPYAFTQISVEYVLRGKNLNAALIQRAVDLSENKYCSVMATVRPGCAISTHFRIEEA